MANLMKELIAEISRISRSEIKVALAPIKSVNATQRKYIADLRRQVASLEKENKTLARQIETLGAIVPKPEPEVDIGRAWITSAGVRSMRKRLKLSQKAFAELAGVSLPSVVKWESPKNQGKLPIRRKEVLARLLEIKTMGLRDLPQQ